MGEWRDALKYTRNELVRMFVLDTVADDYEDVEIIAATVNTFARKCGMDVSFTELLQALEALIRIGWVKAYRLSPTEAPQEINGVPDRDEIESYYFWVTEEGGRVQGIEDSDWPFDEDGVLKPDWCALE